MAHEDTEYEECAFGGSIAYTASQDGGGLSMSLGSGWGDDPKRRAVATARKQGWNVLQTLAHPDQTQLIPQLRH